MNIFKKSIYTYVINFLSKLMKIIIIITSILNTS